MTPQDVKYSFDLAKIATHPQHPLWADTGLKSTKVSGNNVVFTFAGKPGLPAVRLLPLQRRGRPAAHLQELHEHRHRVGQPRRHEEDRRHRAVRLPVRRRRRVDDGRLEEAGRLVGDEGARPSRSAPTYVVDIKNGTNAAALSNLLAGNIDLFNNFAPKSAIKGKFKTYFDEAPYHLGANTTWLFPNTTKKPLNDPAVPPRARRLDQHEPDHRQGLPGPRQQGEPDGPAADLEQVDRQEGRQAVRLLVQRREGEADPRRRRLQGHERRRVRREQGRLADRPQHRLPERVVRLDDRRSR